MKSKLTKLVIVIFLALITAIIVWIKTPYLPEEEAYAALESTKDYLVNTNKWITYEPLGEYNSGVIFYPGARVDPISYAPLCKYLAGENHVCVIIPMPLNLALFGINTADEVRAQYPNINYWIMAGHSLGGAMAARYLSNHLGEKDLKGISLLASYSDVDMSQGVFLATSFYGTRDGIFSKSKWEETKKNLPEKYSIFTEIQGGNHSGFGYYGEQAGDNEATIANEEQFRIFQEAIHDMLPGH